MIRVLGAVLQPDPKGWEHDIQLPPYEIDTPKPENIGEKSSNNPE
jgi:hypothetical protein